MNKNLINKICRRFGFEVHGIGYMQSIKKSDFSLDAYEVQHQIIGDNANIIFDIGANRGDTVLKYAELFPKTINYAFEPFPKSFLKLQENTKDISRIKNIQLGISEKCGESVFYSNFNEDTNSLLSSSEIGLSSDVQVKNLTSILINTTTIDLFCSENNIESIDIIKMDIQGAELFALKGAVNLLKQKKIKLIYLETYFRQQYLNQPLFHDVSSFLYDYGYYLQDIYSPIYGKGSIAWCDVIFMPS